MPAHAQNATRSFDPQAGCQAGRYLSDQGVAVTSVCDEFGGGRTARPSTRSRWLFAVVVFAIGIVPVTAIAKAVSPSGPACPGATYTVVSGDSWYRISTNTKVTMTALMTANGATTATVDPPRPDAVPACRRHSSRHDDHIGGSAHAVGDSPAVSNSTCSRPKAHVRSLTPTVPHDLAVESTKASTSSPRPEIGSTP